MKPLCPRCGAWYDRGAAACEGCARPLEAVGPEPAGGDPLPPLAPHGAPPRTAFRLRPDPAGGFAVPGGAVEVGTKPLLIGRKDVMGRVYPDVDLSTLPDIGYTSRRHAEVRVDGGRLVVTDLPGRDTTAVNDPARTLPGGVPVALAPGDRLILGDVVTFLVEVEDE